ncbi:MAG: potassium channel protein [Anaerolineae bacterium]|nr:potassium channel protein [Anaerolineae bacterium]
MSSWRCWRRRFRAGVRDTVVLVREFSVPLMLFLATLFFGSWSFQALWNRSQPETISYIEALYDTLTMIFFQSAVEFPGEWYLDIYFFVMPTIGLIFLALGAADFVTLAFNRSLRQAKWEEAVTSTLNDHIIVCGLGRLGLRVVRELVSLDEDIVGIEYKADSPNFTEIRSHNIPILVGDARNAEILDKAGLARAKAIIVCTNDDLMNLQMAARIRERNKTVRLIMRMFDEEFARSIADRFDISAALSASLLAAPAFAGAAIGAEIIQTFKVENRVLVMGRLQVQPGSKLEGVTVQALEIELDLSVILLQSGGTVDVHPGPDVTIRAGDVMAVVADLPAIKRLASQWNRANG